MVITDKEVLRELKRVRNLELEEMIESYPEDEFDGRSDMQFFADEVSYLVSLYDEGGTVHSEDLEWAKDVIRETKNGKVTPVYMPSMRPIYRPTDVMVARNSINEYKRLIRCRDRLKEKGIIGRW